jgi:carboxyl-terminal processing protease
MRFWFLLSVLLWSSGCVPTLTSNVFSVIERSYIENPDFSKLRLAAFMGLSKRLPPETFAVKEVNGGLVLDYRLPGSPFSSKTFAARVNREEATRDVDFAYEIARQIAPNIQKEKLETAMLRSAVESLDGTSAFLHSMELSTLPPSESPEASDVGLGIPLRSSSPVAVNPLYGGPAQRAGILAGDRLVAIDGISTVDMELVDIDKKLRGNTGTEIRVTIRREGWTEDRTFSLVRENRLLAVDARFLGDGIGLITQRHFQFRSGQDFEVALRRMEADKIRDLILDLRHTSGGFVYQAVAIAGKFLPRRTVVGRVSGRSLEETREPFTYGEIVRKDLPLFVIVDKETAAVAEFFAAAIQESGRGLLLGEQTAGQTLLTSNFPVPGGSALMLLTHKWFTAKDLSLDGKGLTPDILVEGTQTISDSTQGDLSHDIYLQRAVEVVKERRAKR